MVFLIFSPSLPLSLTLSFPSWWQFLLSFWGIQFDCFTWHACQWSLTPKVIHFYPQVPCTRANKEYYIKTLSLYFSLSVSDRVSYPYKISGKIVIIYIYIYIYMCVCVCVCARARARVYVCMYVCMCVCVYMYIYMCVCVCVCVYIYIYIYIYIYNGLQIGRQNFCTEWKQALPEFSLLLLIETVGESVYLSQPYLCMSDRLW